MNPPCRCLPLLHGDRQWEGGSVLPGAGSQSSVTKQGPEEAKAQLLREQPRLQKRATRQLPVPLLRDSSWIQNINQAASIYMGWLSAHSCPGFCCPNLRADPTQPRLRHLRPASLWSPQCSEGPAGAALCAAQAHHTTQATLSGDPAGTQVTATGVRAVGTTPSFPLCLKQVVFPINII